MAPEEPNELTRRQAAAQEKRQAILEAALPVFAEAGFAAARLDQVAERAGVAKGTIYLHFRDKEDLFESLVLGAVSPVLAQAEQLAGRVDIPSRVMLGQLFDIFRHEVLGTQRKEIALLVIAEGRRFPAIAKFYHREVIARVLRIVRGLAKRAAASGEIQGTAYERFPQLVMAPLLMALIWDRLFSGIDPLDPDALFAAHLTVIFGNPTDKR